MSHTMTIEIEHATGHDIDVGAIDVVLRRYDIKIRTWKPGNHLLAAIELRAARNAVDIAVRLALPPVEGDGLDPAITLQELLDDGRISVRAYNCCARPLGSRSQTLLTVGDVRKCSDRLLLRRKNMGRLTLQQLRAVTR